MKRAALECLEPRHLLAAFDGSVGFEGAENDFAVFGTENENPVPMIETVSEPRLEGTPISIVASASDLESPDELLHFRYDVFKDSDTMSYATSEGVNLTSFSFTPGDDGSYEVVLTVSDTEGGSATASQLIDVANVAPEFTISVDENLAEIGDVVLVTVSATDPAGENDPLSYYYDIQKVSSVFPFVGEDLVSGGGPGQATFEFTPTDYGPYYVNVRVHDGSTSESTGYLTTLVNPSAPMASIPHQVIDEAAGNAELKVELSHAAEQDLVLMISTLNGFPTFDGESPHDFAALDEIPVPILAGETSATFEIPIVDDEIDEPTERFVVAIRDVEPYGSIRNAVPTASEIEVAAILDNDPAPTLDIKSVTVGEGESTARFEVTLSNPSSQNIELTIGTEDISANAESDYDGADVSVLIPAGETSAHFEVPIIDDDTAESLEQFRVRVVNVVTGTMGDHQDTAVAGILDNDGPPDVSIDDIVIGESTGSAEVQIRLSNPSSENITLEIGTETVTADLTDFSGANAEVTISAGETTGSYSVTIHNDSDDEPYEAFDVRVVDVISGVAGRTSDEGRVWIADNDGLPEIFIEDFSVGEGESTANVNVHLSSPSTEEVILTLRTWDNLTAKSPADFELNIAQVTFAPGEVLSTFPVNIVDDNTFEFDESFFVSLVTVDSGTVTSLPVTGQGTIIDNELPPDLVIKSQSVNESAGTVQFDVGLSHPSVLSESVTLRLFDIDTTTDVDVVAENQVITFLPGQTEATFTATIIDDELDEPNESFEIGVATFSATLGDVFNRATITIIDDDIPDNGWADIPAHSHRPDRGNSIAVDQIGNSYVVGTLDLNGDSKLFVTKYDPQGAVVWNQVVGGAEQDVEGNAVEVDDSGSVYVAGAFRGTVNFDQAGTQEGERTNAGGDSGSFDAFVLKLDDSGQFQRVDVFGQNSAAWDKAIAIDVDSHGNVAVLGIFDGSVDFDPGFAEFVPTQRGQEMFLVVLEPAGELLWAKTLGGNGNGIENPTSVKFDDDGNVYIGGRFNGSSVSFDRQATYDDGRQSKTISGTGDAFLAKYDSTGDLLWARTMGAPTAGWESVYGVAIDSLSRINVVGSFQASSSAGFDPGNGDSWASANNSQDIFIVQWDEDGSFNWGHRIGDVWQDRASDVEVDKDGRLNIGGYFGTSADFNPDQSASYFLKHQVGFEREGFFAGFDASGEFLWASELGGQDNDEVRSIDLDNEGNAYLTGMFAPMGYFDTGDGLTTLQSHGFADAFAMRFVNPGVTEISVDSVIHDDTLGTLTVNYDISGSPVPSRPSSPTPPIGLDFQFLRSNDSQFDAGDQSLDVVRLSQTEDTRTGSHSKTFTLGTETSQLDLSGFWTQNVPDPQLLVVLDPLNLIGEPDVDPILEDNSSSTAIDESNTLQVVQVLVSATSWTPEFRNHVDNINFDPDEQFGYGIPKGNGQLDTLPWADINLLQVFFDKPLGPIDVSSLSISGLNGDYSVASFESARNSVTLRLNDTVAIDRAVLSISDSVVGLLGDPLDGEWSDAQTDNSGNGEFGGNFAFTFQVVPGDINRSGFVSTNDIGPLRTGLGRGIGDASYSMFADTNGSGSIGVNDVLPLRRNLGLGIPAAVDAVFAISASQSKSDDQRANFQRPFKTRHSPTSELRQQLLETQTRKSLFAS